jgi:hypothetical protein
MEDSFARLRKQIRQILSGQGRKKRTRESRQNSNSISNPPSRRDLSSRFSRMFFSRDVRRDACENAWSKREEAEERDIASRWLTDKRKELTSGE